MDVGYHPHHPWTWRYGVPYAQALQQAGHRISFEDTGVLLADASLHYPPWSDWTAVNTDMVLYPHAAGVVTYGYVPGNRHSTTRGQFVTGDGQVELAKLAEDIPTVACGWPWTPLLDFKPVEQVRRVLMAPPHAYKGIYQPGELEAWKQAGRRLLKLYPEEAGVKWCVSQTPHPFDEMAGMIMAADLIAACSTTVLALAVALGKPTVWFGSWPEAFSDLQVDDTMRRPDKRLLDRLVDCYRYPYGIAQVEQALTVEAAGWRERFVGPTFDPHKVATAFDLFLGG